MKNTRVKILKIAIDFSEFMPKTMTEYALKIMTSSSRNLTSFKEKNMKGKLILWFQKLKIS
jgi:hypothetical protein